MAYKIRRSRGGTSEHSYDTFTLTLPSKIARRVLDGLGDDASFEVKLTDEGILYYPAKPAEEQNEPAWLGGGGDGA